MKSVNWTQLLGGVALITAAVLGGNSIPPIVPRTTQPEAVQVVTTTPMSWITTKDGKRFENEALAKVLATVEDGVVEGIGIPKPGDPFVYRLLTISPFKPSPSQPTVVPPSPSPSPTPNPSPIKPVTSGPREVVILREAKAVSETMALQLNALRVGANDSYLQSKGHSLYICDDDDVTPDGSPDPYVQSMLRILREENQKTGRNVQVPAEFVVDKATNVLLSLEPFTTSTNTMTHLKASGG